MGEAIENGQSYWLMDHMAMMGRYDGKTKSDGHVIVEHIETLCDYVMTVVERNSFKVNHRSLGSVFMRSLRLRLCLW